MTVFVGELSGYVTEDELHSSQGSGKITCVKIPSEEGCGFVKFEDPHACPKSPERGRSSDKFVRNVYI